MDPMTAYARTVQLQSRSLVQSALPHAPVIRTSTVRSKPGKARKTASAILLRASQALAPA
jgi:hypothetical protein